MGISFNSRAVPAAVILLVYYSYAVLLESTVQYVNGKEKEYGEPEDLP
jgi:hypothetical protein